MNSKKYLAKKTKISFTLSYINDQEFITSLTNDRSIKSNNYKNAYKHNCAFISHHYFNSATLVNGINLTVFEQIPH